MEKDFDQKFTLFNARYNCPKIVIENKEYLYNFGDVVNFHCDTFSFGSLIEEQFRFLIFSFELQTMPWIPIKIHLLKLTEKNLNMYLHDWIREEVKISNLMFDSVQFNPKAISDTSDAQNAYIFASFCTVYDIPGSFWWIKLFSPFPCGWGWYFSNNVPSSDTDMSSFEIINVKNAAAHRPPSELPNRPITTWSRLIKERMNRLFIK